MNRQIVQLFALLSLLFAVLIGFTSYWSVFDAKALKDNSANNRPLLQEQQLKRGRILAADGSVIARSVALGHGSNLRYIRRYPEGALFGHPIGYSFIEQGQSEFEQSHNEELVGTSSEFGSILDQLTGANQEGDDVVTNLDPAAQRAALGGLQAAGFGAVVAIQPRSGRVLAMASNPPFDPNRVPSHLEQLDTNPDSPLLNRATQSPYPPGSTFKVVTAAAGLNSGTITPETTINAPGSLEVQGQPLQNDYLQNFGPISLDTALTNSVNTWFGQLGQRVGESTLFNYMDRFGFNATPPIDLSASEVGKSGIFEGENLLGPGAGIDLARVAIGQERLGVTPLQMAEVAAAVANRGRLMKPQIWSRVVEPDGHVVKRLKPAEYSRPMSEKTAAELTTAMEGVVREGTGTNAAIPGVAVAGKTGTAETPGNATCGGGAAENQGWFIGFAPAQKPKVAIAATVECTTQFGNDVAAPIFRSVAETILSGK
ncbi:MAG TPA: penicillin-binding protein 2 [Solirubrobacterales bacterium]|nr:penicillin-binding protein 2 [Solirubrobacterales bacterium]